MGKVKTKEVWVYQRNYDVKAIEPTRQGSVTKPSIRFNSCEAKDLGGRVLKRT